MSRHAACVDEMCGAGGRTLYLRSRGSRSASRSSMPSVRYLMRVAALVTSSKRME
jgi:hypothetical protein